MTLLQAPGSVPAGSGGPATLVFLPKPGDQLGRFKIEQKLGGGGMGSVYLALDTLLGIKVALKVLNPTGPEDDTFARLSREVLAARKVTHPGICRIFDLHEESGHRFISMEYVEGRTLQSLIDAAGVLPLATVAPLALSICRALDAAHRAGIVHRDLKPANIIVKEHNQASILDFGLAKSVGSEGVTDAGFSVGTVKYMAPEVVRGMPATPLSDIYSLGVILYHAITGRQPVEGATIFTMVRALEGGKAVPPRQFNPEIPPALEGVILKAIEPDPTQRFQTVAELAEALLSTAGPLPEGKEDSVEELAGPWDGEIEKSVGAILADMSTTKTQKIRMHDTTMLFSDMVGITPYFDRYGDMAGTRKIRKHNDLLFPMVHRHHGQVIKTIGDAIMACFETPDDGVEAAVDMQLALKEYNRARKSEDDKIRIRIGVHSGLSIFESSDVFGDTVNVAARISAKAQGDQILISSVTRNGLKRKQGLAHFFAKTTLKGKEEAQDLHEVSWDPSVDQSKTVEMPETGTAAPQPSKPPSPAKVDRQDQPPPSMAVEDSTRTQLYDVAREHDQYLQGMPIVTPRVVPKVAAPPSPPPVPPGRPVPPKAITSKTAGPKAVTTPPAKPQLQPEGPTTEMLVVPVETSQVRRWVLRAVIIGLAVVVTISLIFILVPGSGPEKAVAIAPALDAGSLLFSSDPVPDAGFVGTARDAEPPDVEITFNLASESPRPPINHPANAPPTELEDLKASISNELRDKGILYGDLPAFDSERNKMKTLAQQSRFREALEAGRRALAIIRGVHIDDTFVWEKLERVNKLYDKLDKNSPTAKKIEKVYDDIRKTTDANNYHEANKLLNQAFQLLSSKRK